MVVVVAMELAGCCVEVIRKITCPVLNSLSSLIGKYYVVSCGLLDFRGIGRIHV